MCSKHLCIVCIKLLVRAKLQFEGFDNATQPQKLHWESVRPFFALCYEFEIFQTGPVSRETTLISFMHTIHKCLEDISKAHTRLLAFSLTKGNSSTCNHSIPSFIGNILWVLLLGNRLQYHKVHFQVYQKPHHKYMNLKCEQVIHIKHLKRNFISPQQPCNILSVSVQSDM